MKTDKELDKDWKAGFITVEFLMKKHPELKEEDAKHLKAFSESNTIDRKECYDNGQIIYPMWKAFINEVNKLTK